MGNGVDETKVTGPDCSPRTPTPTPMTMTTPTTSMTSIVLAGSPHSSASCPADIPTSLQYRRQQEQHQVEVLSLAQATEPDLTTPIATSSSSTYEQSNRTPLSQNTILSLSASPKRSASKTPVISKSQMKGKLGI